jgi:zona occludens toxin
MSITIHHGPNGSYKTSGVVQDYFIPAARQGRVVVTNIRGISRERTLMEMPEIPDSFDVVFIDTDTSDGRWKIATWFHWVPTGALLMLDEAGVNFPKMWTANDIKKLDFPHDSLVYCDIESRTEQQIRLESVDAAEVSGRPANWVEAWQKHRHWNWDIILTLPNIKALRDDIRDTAEGAYKHKNRAILGPFFKGYNEGYHDSTKNGVSQSDFDSIKGKRIANLTFRLYDSTKTGVFKGTLNGFNLFLTPRVLILLLVAGGAFAYSIGSGGAAWLYGNDLDDLNGKPGQRIGSEPVSASVPGLPGNPVAPSPGQAGIAAPSFSDKAGEVDLFKNLAASFDNAGRNVVSGSRGSVVGRISEGPLQGIEAYIVGAIRKDDQYTYLINLVNDEKVQTLMSVQLLTFGYRIRQRGDCAASVIFGRSEALLTCVSIQAAR